MRESPETMKETPCCLSPDGLHCAHWYDDPDIECCYCHKGGKTTFDQTVDNWTENPR